MSETEPTGGATDRQGRHVRVVFVCWGNICRSPMAERVAERMAAEQGLTGVEFTSAATSSEELGAPIDRRAEAVLREHGYRVDGHKAHPITSLPDDLLAEIDEEATRRHTRLSC